MLSGVHKILVPLHIVNMISKRSKRKLCINNCKLQTAESSWEYSFVSPKIYAHTCISNMYTYILELTNIYVFVFTNI